MTTEERARLESLDTVLRSENVREQIRQIVERVRAELDRKKAALMTWESVPLSIFGSTLPAQIRSAWVFVLRAGADTGVERHPNSHQRMMSFEGSGDMRTGTVAIECFGQQPGRADGTSLDFNPAECLASPGGWRGGGLGGCFISHCPG